MLQIEYLCGPSNRTLFLQTFDVYLKRSISQLGLKQENGLFSKPIVLATMN